VTPTSPATQSRHGTHYEGSEDERRALGAFVKLLRAAWWVSERAGEHRKEAGLTETQWGVLEALYHLGPMVQTRLAHKLLSSASNLTRVLDNLERDGLVVRERDEEDRRCYRVRLTAEGRRAVDDVLPGHVRGIVRIMGALSPGEQEELGDLCRKLGRAAAARGDEGSDAARSGTGRG
jgi:MarR family 2-MHQ and catechol resistance regulon transcriptional repressor